jgi:exosortase
MLLWVALVLLSGLVFLESFKMAAHIWLNDDDYSFCLLIPLMVGYLLWRRRRQFLDRTILEWRPGLLLVVLGCTMQIVASRSGALLLSGIAFVLIIFGVVGLLWGRERLSQVAGPLCLFLLMIPLPSYVVGEFSWYLQSAASSGSRVALGFLGVPVFQDGNMLHLANYILEVKQACSGSRSTLALLAFALVLGLVAKSNFLTKASLVLAAPLLAVGTNVIRIVGTGLIARRWGSLAANESLHEAWGILIFMIAVSTLLGLDGLLRKATCRKIS